MEQRICAKLTYVLLLLDKAEEAIHEIKQEIGATPSEQDLIFSLIPFAINCTTHDKKDD